MAYRVELASRATRDLDALPDRIYRKVQARIDALVEEPRPHGVKKLEGDENLYRIRVGDYRIVYQIQDKKLLVLVVRIGNRRDVYRSL